MVGIIVVTWWDRKLNRAAIEGQDFATAE